MMSPEQSEHTSREDKIATKATLFHYKRSKIISIDLGLAFLAATTVLATTAARHGKIKLAIIFFASSYGFLLPLYIMARLGASTIRVDDNTISCIVFGHVWKTIKWRNVKFIRTFVLPANPLGGYGRSQKFVVDYSSRTKPPFKPVFLPNGPIAFSDEIVGSRALLDLINIYVVRYQIPIRSRVTASGDLAKEARIVERL